jgi:hypothetical protein
VAIRAGSPVARIGCAKNVPLNARERRLQIRRRPGDAAQLLIASNAGQRHDDDRDVQGCTFHSLLLPEPESGSSIFSWIAAGTMGNKRTASSKRNASGRLATAWQFRAILFGAYRLQQQELRSA